MPTATIAIIGGGFCGTVLAANLLRRPPAGPTRILLIERHRGLGGVAYRPSAFPCLVNVPAARMSATSCEPAQWIEFARRSVPGADGEAYLPRQLYGEYLRELLHSAQRAAPLHVHLERIRGEVSAVCPPPAAGPILWGSDCAPVLRARWSLPMAAPQPDCSMSVPCCVPRIERRPRWASCARARRLWRRRWPIIPCANLAMAPDQSGLQPIRLWTAVAA